MDRFSGVDCEQGFTLVEVIISLAIASLVVLIIGDAYRNLGDLNYGTTRIHNIQLTLLHLRELRGELEAERGLDAADFSTSNSGSLVQLTVDTAVQNREIVYQLSLNSQRHVILERDGRILRDVNVSFFDETALEALVVENGNPAWALLASQDMQDIRAVRVRLIEGRRVWPLVLWRAGI